MSTSLIAPVIGTVIVTGWAGLLLWAAVSAFRGRRYWATWLMLVGAVVQLLGGLAYGCMMFLALYSFSSSGGGAMGPAVTVLAVSGILLPLGILLFSIGLVGICARFGMLEKRAAELEELNRHLQERIQG